MIYVIGYTVTTFVLKRGVGSPPVCLLLHQRLNLCATICAQHKLYYYEISDTRK